MLKQTIISKAMEQKQAQLQSQPEKIGNIQFTQQLQGTSNSYLNQVHDVRNKTTNVGGSDQDTSGQQSRLESLIQQLIIRKEITQSPAIQKKQIYDKKTGQNLAQLSLQMANQVQATAAGGRKISANSFQQNQPNLVNDLNVQKHSAEDLLMIEKDISCSPAAVNNHLTRNLAMNQIKIKTNRPSQSSQQQHNITSVVKNVSLNQKVKGGSASKTSGLNQVTRLKGQNLRGINRLSNEPIGEQGNTPLLVQNPKGFTLSQNAEFRLGEADRSFRDNNMSESLGLPLYFSQNNQTTQNTMMKNTLKGQTISDSNASFLGGPGGTLPTQTEEIIAGMQNATIGGDLRVNSKKQNFISLDQSKLLDQTNTNQSVGSLGEIYEKTLSAFQNDLNQLNEINQTREEISTRLKKHQSILNSLQADAVAQSKRDSRQETSQNDIVLHRQLTQPLQTIQAESNSQGSANAQQVVPQPMQQQHPNSMYVFINQNQHASVQQPNQQNISINSTLLTQSHRNSVVESTLHTSKGGPSINTVKSTLATSPIVGRYRLKYLNNPSNQISVYQNQNQKVLAQNPADAKRTKSVRQRRGLPLGAGGSNLRGGRRLYNPNPPADQQQQKYAQNQNIPGGQKKLESLVFAYRSTGGGDQNSLLNPTNSQQSFTAQGQGQTQQIQPQRKLMQTLDSGNLNQTYGVPQKYQSTTVTGTLIAKQKGSQRVSVTSGRSVPRQRQGGLSSNMRPPVKQTDRSFSNNRNRAQQSFRNTSSFVARNTYASVNSGSMNSQQQQQLNNMLHGSQNAILQQSFNPNMSDVMAPEMMDTSAVSPINTRTNTKYGRAGIAQQQAVKRGQKKSTSRGRGAVASSTSLAGPGVRKHSKITQGQKAAQMSQQQVYQIRGSLQTQAERGKHLTVQVSPGHSPHNQLSQSRLSPDQIIKNMRQTPDIKDASPVNIHRGPMLNQKQIQTQPKPGSLSNDVKNRLSEDFNNQMSVGGQVIVNAGGIQSTGSGMQNLNRNHNLRYSQHNDDLTQLVDEEQIQNNQPVPVVNSEAQQRQDEAMKLINEDNPFENPASIAKASKQNNAKLGMLQADEKDEPVIEYGVDKNDGDGSGSSQTMSFAETKSIASKTTNRASKNTNGTTAISGMSGGLTNQLTFSKLSRKLVPSGGAGQGTVTGTGGQGRLSLLGAGAMRRSEATEDSQQCKYMDGTLIMSSLPMPMHSIKQVIAEEEAAAEQDERTTNKESSKYQINAQQQTKGSDPSKGSKGPGTEKESSSNKDTGGDNNTGGEPAASRKSAKGSLTQHTESESLRLIQSLSKANTNNQYQDPEEYNDMKISDSGVNICETPKMSLDRGSKSLRDIQNSQLKHSASQSQNKKQYLDYNNHIVRSRKMSQQSEDGNILLDESNNSIQFQEESGVICEITPNVMFTKDVRAAAVVKARHNVNNHDLSSGRDFRASSSRKHEQVAKPLDDFPPQLSESSARAKPSLGGSGHHSDDDVEVRRGLESENVRTDMGSNPELLRQSTHSLLHKTQLKDAEVPADLLVLKKQTSQQQKQASRTFADVNDAYDNSVNAISDEIDVRLSNSSSLNLRRGIREARNNNYFGAEQSFGKKKYTRKVKHKAKVKQFEQFEEDSEEMVDEIRVGKIDADEFTLKKVN